MKYVNWLPSFVRNKYLLATGFFVVWMLFFDRNDVFTQLGRTSDLKEIETSKQYFAEKIAAGKKFTADMENSSDALEKYAREKFLMKRPNEDLFLVTTPEKE